MNQNKSIPFVIGGAVIVLAAVIVLVQYSNTKNKSTVPAQNNQVTTTSQAYTLTIVANHNSQSSCWTAINGNVYDVTKWIGQHPGGAQAIIGLCGKDGSSAFNDQHGGQRKPENELASFKIGTLTK